MSTTTNLGLFKHDNPATNTDQFDVDKAINQNLDKVDAAIGKDRERISELEVGQTIYDFKGTVETLTELNSKVAVRGDVWYCKENSTYYAYNGSEWIPVNLNLNLGVIEELEQKTIKVLQEVETPQPVKGENIHLTDSAEYKIQELNLSGNSKQEITVQGKNLLKGDGYATPYTNSRYWRNSSANKGFSTEGYAQINAENTGTGYTFVNFYVNPNQMANLNTNTNYKAVIEMADVTISGDVIFSLNSYDGDTSANKITEEIIQGYTPQNGIKVYSFTTKSDLSKINMLFRTYIRLSAGASFSGKIRLMILNSDVTDYTYEKYIPDSPTPEYPSYNKSCGDNMNLFNKSQAGTRGYYNSSGVFTSSTVYNYFEFIPKPNLYYTIKTTNKYSVNVYFVGFDENENITLITNFFKNEITFNSSNYKKIGYSIHADDFDNCKLEQGSKSSGYSPYGQGCIDIKIGNKNIFDGIFEQGSLYDDGTINHVNDAYSIVTSNLVKVVPGKTYIFSSNENYKINRFCYFDKTKTIIGRSGNLNTNIITIPLETHYIKFNVWKEGITINNITNAQLEKGSIATNYVSHQSQTYTVLTQQPMRKIGEYEDIFIKKNGKRYERHYIYRYEFTGTETFTSVTNGTTQLFRTTMFSSLLYSNDSDVIVLSNIAKGCANVNWTTYATDDTVFGGSNGLIQFILPDIASLDDFTALLKEKYEAGTPVYVDYVLATPIDLECTEEQNAILDEIEDNAKTYQDVTHIYSTDEISPNISVTYKKDIAKLFASTIVESGV